MNRIYSIPHACRYSAPTVQHRVYSWSAPTQRFSGLVRHGYEWQLYRSTLPSYGSRREPLSTDAIVQESQRESDKSEGPQPAKRKKTRSPAAKNSLRRVAVEAQRSRDGIVIEGIPGLEDRSNTKVALGYLSS